MPSPLLSHAVDAAPDAAELRAGQWFVARDENSGIISAMIVNGITSDQTHRQTLTSHDYAKLAENVTLCGLSTNKDFMMLLPFPTHIKHIEATLGNVRLRGFAADTKEEAIRLMNEAYTTKYNVAPSNATASSV